MGELDFADWLQAELDKRDWRQSNLARLGKINTGLLAQVMSRSRKPGPSTLMKIADALRVSREEVFARWGYLNTPTGERAKMLAQIQFNAQMLSSDGLEELNRFAEFLSAQSKENDSDSEEA